MWRIRLDVSADLLGAFEPVLADGAIAVSSFDDGAGRWGLEAITADAPQIAQLSLRLALAAAALGVAPPVPRVEPVAEHDWLAENRERFAPFRVGRFHVQEPDDRTPLPAGPTPLRIEAASAFGSGRHGSTEGCLRALDRLALRRFFRPADVGCGSGILAIAAARRWRVPVLATDIDPAAVAVARANARLNGVGALVRVVTAPGYRSPVIAAAAPFDLVTCNILARPLKRLAHDLARHLAPGGIAILGGFLAADAKDVAAVHRAHGMRLAFTLDIEGWRTLVLERP